MIPPVDALMVVSFGGPEGPDDVIAFLDNVTRGRGVPSERLAEVARNYAAFGGVSPLNAQMRELVQGLTSRLENPIERPGLPVYWGNRNWHPMLTDTIRQMADDGIAHALAFATSAYSSYSGCRQYLDDLVRAREAVGPTAPRITKLAPFFDRDEFTRPFMTATSAALANRPAATTALVATAHALPRSMAASCDYESQLRSVLDRIVEATGHAGRVELAWQSRSGPPAVPWLEPDIGALLPRLSADGITHVVAVPIGFLTDHFEVIWDLDVQAAGVAARAGLDWLRVPTPGPGESTQELVTHLVEEARSGNGPRPCPADCCPPPGPTD